MLCVRYAINFVTGSVADRRTARPYEQYDGSSGGEPLARLGGTPTSTQSQQVPLVEGLDRQDFRRVKGDSS